MAAPSAREVGSVGVRALPLTDKFRGQLLRDLRRIEKTVDFNVDVNIRRVRLNRARTKASIQSQLNKLDDLTLDAKVKVDGSKIAEKLREATRTTVTPHIDEVFVRRIRRDIEDALRRVEATVRPHMEDDWIRYHVDSLAREFDRLSGKLTDDIMSPSDAAALRHRINEIDDALDEVAKNRETRVDANPFTAWASARLAWLTRPRTVEVIPVVSQAALAKAMTALAALSGARLSFDYLDRFAAWMAEVDKKLPRLTFGITGAAVAFSALMGSISGIVGIGDGLAAILPSLLLLPGLLAGTVMSGVAIFVAMKDAKDELDELGDSYTNLGKIIKRAFWGEARQSIINLSNSVMPQLERSFDKTSTAIGRFTAKLAQSFEREFADGRLEAMFDGLTASWENLSKGTDAFAGAITNLGLVAARYMPRLADWFVRQSITFDEWLSKVSTDGRLDQWLNEAFDAIYAVWDVTAATTGIFQALWKAAEAGGSGGLRGFADMMLRWEKAIQGDRWQETLIAMFRGSGEALRGFGDGVERFGEALHYLRDDIEYVLGVAGGALGSFLGSISEAISTPKFGDGMRRFIDGVASGLESLEPAMRPLADAFGTLAGFIGDLAKAVGPVLAETLEVLAPLLEDVLDSIDLDSLSDTMVETIRDLAPTFEELARALILALPQILDLAEEALPVLADLLNLMTGSEAEGRGGLLKWFGDLQEGGSTPLQGLTEELTLLNDLLDGMAPGEAFIRFLDRMAQKDAFAWVGDIMRWMVDFKIELDNFFADPFSWLVDKGADIIIGLLHGAHTAWENGKVFFTALQVEVPAMVANPIGWLVDKGSDVLLGFLNGINQRFPGVGTLIARIPELVKSALSNPWGWLYESGRSVIDGFVQGIQDRVASAVATVQAALQRIRNNFPFSPAKEGPFAGQGWVAYSGQSVGDTFGSSVAASVRAQRARISSELARVQSQFAGIGSLGSAGSGDGATPFAQRVVNFTVNNPVVRDLFEDDWASAQESGVFA